MGKMKVLKFAAVVFCAVLLLTFVGLAGCSAPKSDSATQAAWSITIKDSSAKEVQWTNEDAGKLEMVEVSAELEKKDGTKVKENWKGVLLSEVLKSAGINQYATVAVEAADGYRQEYDAATVNDGGTILGFFLDGKEISVDDGLVELVVPTLTGKFWIKNIAVIEVIN
jgi:DMSO/TMAO reductase YedYZ molybdopterin-dependent catalytic subunit